MKSLLAITLATSIISVHALAEKPEWAGSDKPTAEQKDAHRNAIKAKQDLEDKADEKYKKVKQEKIKKEKIKKEKNIKDGKEQRAYKSDDLDAEQLKGLEKQRAKKAEQVQKELDKGSEQGKASRDANSKKWWKFWGE